MKQQIRGVTKNKLRKKRYVFLYVVFIIEISIFFHTDDRPTDRRPTGLARAALARLRVFLTFV